MLFYEFVLSLDGTLYRQRTEAAARRRSEPFDLF
jgi:hypothetical protein